MELEVTWRRAARVWWSYLWRNLVAILIAFAFSTAVGFAVGFGMRIMGASATAIYGVTAPLGFAMGLIASIVPLKMVLGRDFGEFRLVLLSKPPRDSDTATQPKRSRRHRGNREA